MTTTFWLTNELCMQSVNRVKLLYDVHRISMYRKTVGRESYPISPEEVAGFIRSFFSAGIST